ncbi:MAG TPA: nucleotide exchange factor GrpE [Sedimenticola thiotaurini]|uniref:Protein GrpE n=1 Tax=Sedimenticola thiotaurini TaxID=1543721 RepID=A0A831RNR5_9GAMM|nr:nucleotide exchange factor GrpE [Sedimenticola thiotaurini]
MEKEQESVAGQSAEQPEDAAGQEQQTGGDQGDASHEELRLLLEDARAKADDHWDQLVRARAELDNLRKRQARELENAHKFALERFAKELLPVRDSLELGLSAAQESNTDVDKLKEGMELTLKLLTDVMAKFDIVEIDPQDEPFNPELHQAMSMQPRDDVPPNTVVNVVQKGYTLNGRVIRPAMVMVSQAAS